MIQQWLVELLKGVGKVFLNPILYYSIILAIVSGIARVKRERRDFHISVHRSLQELRFLFPAGLFIGFCLSIITVAAGLTVSQSIITYLVITTIVLTLLGNFRFLSPAFTLGIGILVTFLAKHLDWNLPFIDDSIQLTTNKSISGWIVVLGLLLIIEGIQMIRNGSRLLSPKLRRSRRGLTVGAHQAKRIWLIPVFFFLPAGPLTAPFEWWPTFNFGTQTFSLVLVPFLIGFHQQIQSTLPQLAVKRMGKQVLGLGIVITGISVGGMWISILSMAAVAIAIIGRGWISIQHRMRENATPYYFTPQKNGVMVLAVIPGSPAEKMALETGEIIHKCNGELVKNKDQFYESLQKNGAYCKLEIYDVNGEIRFVQGALFQGDHHELGILTVEDRNKWGKGEAS